MKVLITGASSGLGAEMARQLAPKCEAMVLTGRNEERLEKLKEELSGACAGIKTVSLELDKPENCYKLHEDYPDVDFLINNAGFGDFGEFTQTSLEKELSMIDTNVRALHILTKLYLCDMVKADRGRILNVASIAAFMPGPLMATYYATKAYVMRLSESVRKELKKAGSKVKISILCPGPVKTGFEKAANIKFNFEGADCRKVVKDALKHLDRYYTVPTFPVRIGKFFVKISPSRLIATFIYMAQNRRRG